MLYRVHALYSEPLQDMPRLDHAHCERTVLATRCDAQLQGLPAPAITCSHESWWRTAEAAQEAAAQLRKLTQPLQLLLSREHPLFERADAPGVGHAGAIKGKFLFRRRADLGLQAFREYWHDRHGPIVLRTPELLRYVQSHIVPIDADDAPEYDGITELYWFDHDAALRSMASQEMREEQSSDAPNFVDSGSLVVVLLREEIV